MNKQIELPLPFIEFQVFLTFIFPIKFDFVQHQKEFIFCFHLWKISEASLCKINAILTHQGHTGADRLLSPDSAGSPPPSRCPTLTPAPPPPPPLPPGCCSSRVLSNTIYKCSRIHIFTSWGAAPSPVWTADLLPSCLTRAWSESALSWCI